MYLAAPGLLAAGFELSTKPADATTIYFRPFNAKSTYAQAL